ncbi:MAG: hemolysin family protein [Spirochaetes bacterium]|nr:hemolysin family protein [Spirochaetota bacterium]
MSNSLGQNIFAGFFSKKDKSEDFILTLLKDKHLEITEYEKKMITNIVNLTNITVKEVMVPRVDVICIDKNIDINEIINIVEKEGRSRLPVFDENIDNIVGMLHAKDLLKYFINKANFDLSKIIRSAYFVPESKLISNLLVEMREQKNHLAIVVDEYGGFSGIVCLEDIIEKIVGEIQDEFDNEVDDVISIGENEYMINARISLEELNEALGTSFDNPDIDTLGGLIYMLFERIPSKNEKVQYQNYVFTIEHISGRKIEKVKLQYVDDNGEKNQ